MRFAALMLLSGAVAFVATQAPWDMQGTQRQEWHIRERAIATSEAVPSSTSTSVSPTGGGLLDYTDDECGRSGAEANSTTSSGPNGAQKWLNCGLSESSSTSGWTPPTLALSQLKTVTLTEALAMANSAYTPCAQYQDLFEKYADQESLPPILLAAFAMQESSCDSTVLGDSGGAYGLMQITEDKCGNAPGGNCSDAEYNVKTAAQYFSKTLEEQDGNFLLAIGTYNGWHKGLSFKDATAAASGDCCECQNNLDYLEQMLNGWLLGLDGSQLGTIRNLDTCPS
ncbi:hypothetical protein JCM10207_000764 [Rhodosporidiobolus poonsookiae]